MPYIRLNSTKKISGAQKQALSNRLTEAVKLIPNKTVLILCIEDAKTIFIANKEQEDHVFIEFDMCGDYDIEIRRKFATAAFATVTDVLGTTPDKTGIRITQHSSWGGFGDYIEVDKDGNVLSR